MPDLSLKKIGLKVFCNSCKMSRIFFPDRSGILKFDCKQDPEQSGFLNLCNGNRLGVSNFRRRRCRRVIMVVTAKTYYSQI